MANADAVHLHIADDADPVLHAFRIIIDGGSQADSRWLTSYFAGCDGVQVQSLIQEMRERLSDRLAVSWSERGHETQLLNGTSDTSVLIYRRAEITPGLFAAMPALKLIQQFGESPFKRLSVKDVPAGVHIRTIKRGALVRTAEHTMLLALALVKRLPQSMNAVGAPPSGAADPQDAVCYNWPRLRDIAGLHDRRFGIVGLGEVGRYVAERARGFGVELLYHNRRRLRREDERALGVTYVSFETLLTESDILSLHVPYSEATHHIVGKPELSKMKPSSILVNTGRGRLVDEGALIRALEVGTIRGAGLDVFYDEPLPVDSPLLSLDNVILTPHVAGGDRILLFQEYEEVLRNIENVVSDSVPLNGRRR